MSYRTDQIYPLRHWKEAFTQVILQATQAKPIKKASSEMPLLWMSRYLVSDQF